MNEKKRFFSNIAKCNSTFSSNTFKISRTIAQLYEKKKEKNKQK